MHDREACPLQDTQMLRRGWQRHRERTSELANGGIPSREPREHSTPGRIRERVERPVEHFSRVYHLV
jgi:hypothetical protein